MTYLLHDLIRSSAARAPHAPALLYKDKTLDYLDLWQTIQRVAAGLHARGLQANDRVAVYLPKQPEAVQGLFAATLAGGVFVPVNPVLKAEQVGHILRDCNVRALITSADRAAVLVDTLAGCTDLRELILLGDAPLPAGLPGTLQCTGWTELAATQIPEVFPPRIDADMAAILYTSGSTGSPKGVVLSHRNMVAGARSVAEYLQNTASDRLLAVLPFSFDYGLSQLTTAFAVGASVVLMDYLLPRDVIRAVERYTVTGLAAVPPLWNQLAALAWPDATTTSLRYLTNSGGAMPVPTTQALRHALPSTRIYLMYGLTEAFRSTYLPPEQIDIRPESMGKAIPNAQILVVRPDGSACAPDEAGELVHRGALVALGYWGDRERTAQRFKPAPGQPAGLPITEPAVWSGDQVRQDADGYLYFLGRNDEMIKTSGYRVSPSEIEEVAFRLNGVQQAIAFGAPHTMLGQGIVLVVQSDLSLCDPDVVLSHCRAHLPAYMVPGAIRMQRVLPRNANGKIDRKALAQQYQNIFVGAEKTA